MSRCFKVALCKTISITVPVCAENEACARSIAFDANKCGEYAERWKSPDVSEDVEATVVEVLDRYLVKITEMFKSFAVVEAKNQNDAEDIVSHLAESGAIDGVGTKGTLKSGGFERNVECIGKTEDAVTVLKTAKKKGGKNG